MAQNLTLTQVLAILYDREVNVEISCFWDGGWDVKIGDEANGYEAEANFDNAALKTGAVSDWLIQKACEIYSESDLPEIFNR